MGKCDLWIRRTRVSNRVEMRGAVAFICKGMRGTASRKCVEINARNRGLRGNASCVDAFEPRLECAGREWEARGKCGSSAAQARGTAIPRIGGSRIYTGPAR